MSNQFIGNGNLGAKPILKQVQIKGDARDVMEFTVWIDRNIKDESGEFTDKGGFWLKGVLWGRRAVASFKTLEKGMRVFLSGDLIFEQWHDKETGELKTGFSISADWVAIDPITYSRKK